MEERHNMRVPFHVKATVKFKDAIIEGDIENLSMNGLLMKSSVKIDEESVCRVTVFLSGASSELTLDLSGKVVRSDEKGIAINFIEMDLDSFIHLKNIIAFNQIDTQKIISEFENAAIDTNISD